MPWVNGILNGASDKPTPSTTQSSTPSTTSSISGKTLTLFVFVFVTVASFLNITVKTGIANLSEISYYEILANEHHHKSP